MSNNKLCKEKKEGGKNSTMPSSILGFGSVYQLGRYFKGWFLPTKPYNVNDKDICYKHIELYNSCLKNKVTTDEDCEDVYQTLLTKCASKIV